MFKNALLIDVLSVQTGSASSDEYNCFDGFYVMNKRRLIGSLLLFDLVILLIVIGLVLMVPAASSNTASIILVAGCIFYFLSKTLSGLIKLLFDDNYGF